MKIKAGKYTLALTMIACGVLLLINVVYGHGLLNNLWMYSPLVLILFGLEIIILNTIYMRNENYNVEISVGSIILAAFVVVVFTIGTNEIKITSPLLNEVISF